MTLPETPLQIDIGASLFLTLHKAATRQVDAAIDALQGGCHQVRFGSGWHAVTGCQHVAAAIAAHRPPRVRMAEATPESLATVHPKGVDFDIEHRARLVEAWRSACDADFGC